MAIGTSEPEYETPTRGDSLAEQVYRQLCSAILSGSFAPDERITIRRLADDLRVSATPAREAVLRLISDGVLQATERNAIVVPARTEAEIEEIFGIRRSLEGSLAAKAASLLDESDLAFLSNTQEIFLKALDARDYKEVLRYNSQFHFRIYRRADLPVHLRIVEGLWLRIGPTLRYMYPILHADRDRHRRHENIIDRARAHDREGLKAAVLADLDTSEKALHRYLGQAASEPRSRRVASSR
jgi:DNA-binding GntR family transcriptional regulator